MEEMTKQEQLLGKFRLVHDKYDYSKVVYINNKTKVKITCPEHGDFEQAPGSHLNGSGCPKCAIELQIKNQTYTTDSFVKKAKEIHGETYDYSEVDYSLSRVKVKIKCRDHGFFKITPNKHLLGNGCKICSTNISARSRSLGKEEFIKRAIEIHGNKYNYELVDYVSIDKKVKIICPIHGVREQTPWGHLKTTGCGKCSVLKGAKVKRHTTEDFMSRAKKVHLNRYDYSEVEYKGQKVPVKIRCKIHGFFFQRPYNHLSGKGCSACSESRGERLICKILSNNNIKYTRQYRIPLNIKYSYDIYLPDHNLLIEFQGIQHYQPVKFFGGESQFNKQLSIDAIKRFMAKKLQYKLLEIKYTFLEELSETEFECMLLKNIDRLSKNKPFTPKPVLEKWG